MLADPPLMLVPLSAMARWTEVPDETVRYWKRQGRFTVMACDVRSRALLVDWTEFLQLRDARPTRRQADAGQVANGALPSFHPTGNALTDAARGFSRQDHLRSPP